MRSSSKSAATVPDHDPPSRPSGERVTSEVSAWTARPSRARRPPGCGGVVSPLWSRPASRRLEGDRRGARESRSAAEEVVTAQLAHREVAGAQGQHRHVGRSAAQVEDEHAAGRSHLPAGPTRRACAAAVGSSTIRARADRPAVRLAYSGELRLGEICGDGDHGDERAAAARGVSNALGRRSSTAETCTGEEVRARRAGSPTEPSAAARTGGASSGRVLRGLLY